MGGGKKRVEIEAGDGVDRISALPAHLKECILEFVSMKDAMKTSVLSSKWRYCWTRMRKLDFIDVERNSVAVFRRAIDRILLLHSGPIREFKISVPWTRNRRNFNLSDWFYVLSENGIHDIEIDGFDSYDIDGFTVMLPSALFHCQDLKTLRLDRCNLSPPLRFVGFSNLLSLDFNLCTVPSLVLGSFISQCPLLEYLSLTCTHTQNNNQPLVINALNLRTVFFEDEELGSIIFESVPRLTYVKFSISAMELMEVNDMEWGMPPGSWPRICSLSGIMALEFHIFSLGFNNIKTKGLPKPDNSGEAAQKMLDTEAGENGKLSNLLTVIFKDIEGLSHEMLLVKIMLSRCPYLKSFKISPDSYKTTKGC